MKKNPNIDIRPYESYLSIFYRMIRERYVGRSQVLAEYNLSEKKHFFSIETPDWLRELTKTPDAHLPITYCPVAHITDSRRLIKFCPECMRAGFHSVFFMLSSVLRCSIHQCALLAMCHSCHERFLGTVSIDSYFDCAIEIGRMDVSCQTCNLTWPNMIETDDEVFDSLTWLSYFSILNNQAEWYQLVIQGVAKSSQLCKDYYSSTITQPEVIAPLEARFNRLSYERVVGIATKEQRAYWIRFSNELPQSRMTTDQYHYLRDLVAACCLDLKQKYLSCHDDCCAEINSLTKYMPLSDASARLCIPALAYIVLRLKLACAIWPTPNSVSAEKSCFDNFFQYIDSGISRRSLSKILYFFFLKIMGDIQYNVEKGNSFDILLRAKPITRDTFFFRRSSYKWRENCFLDLEIDRPCWISATNKNCKLSVIWQHDLSNYHKTMFV